MARRDDSPPSTESSGASISSFTPLEESVPHSPSRTRHLPFRIPKWRRQAHSEGPFLNEKRRIHIRQLIKSAILILLLTSLAIVTWLALILTVANRLRIPHLNNGLQKILETYHAPNSTHAAYPTWVEDFSRGVKPVSCHSHNDYWHRIPLYEGLAVGCVGTEADIWIGNHGNGTVDLFVGHNQKSLTQSRTLRTLYLDPLYDILSNQNTLSSSLPNVTNATGTQDAVSGSPTGVFSTSPSTSLILALDMKTDGHATWDTVIAQLDTLRVQDWLTYWTPSQGVVQRPITIVGTGNTPFDLVISNSSYRNIFFDAPLTSLSDPNTPYNSNNSYYASSSIKAAIGTVSFGKLSGGQRDKVTAQVDKANQLDLRSRYWDTVSWPVGWRNRVWEQLEDLEVGILNVDDLAAGARWDWEMCVVGGVNICNS
ncbi:uncharacterized protein LY89DRAFT_736580 [Mollisia scopiformis]|uniref:Altered inheritance of mitochondria protein 6 n=1 Tax=Mollisia scopiformis TaxID=149040 RepID=A0A194X3E4_MOLSC|nr:uncharacterized protein LY89DRAFT_736580 [Mollisia scopiformis]KUJ14549.1 hypothetical protein LY89DRAFT_736580 [Mollisia scopiformis]